VTKENRRCDLFTESVSST